MLKTYIKLCFLGRFAKTTVWPRNDVPAEIVPRFPVLNGLGKSSSGHRQKKLKKQPNKKIYFLINVVEYLDTISAGTSLLGCTVS